MEGFSHLGVYSYDTALEIITKVTWYNITITTNYKKI